MAVVILQVFVSLLLVLGSLILFGVSIRNRDHEHADRLSLLPMADDDAAPAPPAATDAKVAKESHGNPDHRL